MYTPMIGNTPAANYGGASTYTTMNTPNYQGGFSPGPGYGASPGYTQSPNPYMSSYGADSPAYRVGQSPMYQGYQSPIYRVTDNVPNAQNIAANQASPIYSPTGQARSPSYLNTVSPVYSGSAGVQSPGYSPTQSGMNPAYSPTG